MPAYALEPVREGTPDGVVIHAAGAVLDRWLCWTPAVRQALLSHRQVRVVPAVGDPPPPTQARRDLLMTRLLGERPVAAPVVPEPVAEPAPDPVPVDPPAHPLAPGGALARALQVEARIEAKGDDNYCAPCNLPFASARAYGQHRRHHHPNG